MGQRFPHKKLVQKLTEAFAAVKKITEKWGQTAFFADAYREQLTRLVGEKGVSSHFSVIFLTGPRDHLYTFAKSRLPYPLSVRPLESILKRMRRRVSK
jgi:hypothetical protein